MNSIFEYDSTFMNLQKVSCESFCISTFSDESWQEPFAQLPLKFLIRILETNELNVKSEVIVVEMVKNWLKADSENRIEHLETLLRAVRLDQLLLSHGVFKNVTPVECLPGFVLEPATV